MVWITPVQLNSFDTKMNWTENESINFFDFNRIENNLVEISNRLNSIHYRIPVLLLSVLNRNNSSIDYLSSINRIEKNLENIKNNFAIPIGWQATKEWVIGMGFTFEDVNRLENNIQLLMDLSIDAFNNFKYCGTITCGGEGVIY